jgi:hypothetical protein
MNADDLKTFMKDSKNKVGSAIKWNVNEDGEDLRDISNWDDFPLEFLGIQRNPDNNEVWFITESGGYTDMLRSLAYAEEISKKTNQYCKVIFRSVKNVLLGHVDSHIDWEDPEWKGRSKDEVMWTSDDDKNVLVDILREFKVSDRIRVCFVPSSHELYTEDEPYFTLMVRPLRAWAVTNWLGVPTLQAKRGTSEGNYIAAWTTELNHTPTSAKRDPVGSEGMEEYLTNLEEMGFVVKRISYRDLGSEKIFETIAGAKLCIGYEGLGNMISRLYRKPLITFSKSKYLSRLTGGQWCLVTDKVENHLYNIADIVSTQKKLIDDCTPWEFSRIDEFPQRSMEYYSQLKANMRHVR